MKAIAPGKLILSGEHAVVYGRPALAMAIDRCAEVVITEDLTSPEVSFNLEDLRQSESFTLRTLQDLKSRLARNYHQFLEGEMGIREVLRKPVELFQYVFITVLDGLHVTLQSGVKIHLRSTIPIGCGLGSSSATIMSVARAAGHYFRVDFRPDWCYKYSLEAERLQHGQSSGLDPYISLHGGCALFQQGQARKIPLPRFPLHLVNTGQPLSTTGECVSHVGKQFSSSAIWDDFGAVTMAMEQAFRTNDQEKMSEQVRLNHRLLTGIGVVPEKVQQFIREVESTGGSAKVCGAGAVKGDAGGMVLMVAQKPPEEICQRYGFNVLTVRGDPLGARII